MVNWYQFRAKYMREITNRNLGTCIFRVTVLGDAQKRDPKKALWKWFTYFATQKGLRECASKHLACAPNF